MFKKIDTVISQKQFYVNQTDLYDHSKKHINKIFVYVCIFLNQLQIATSKIV